MRVAVVSKTNYSFVVEQACKLAQQHVKVHILNQALKTVGECRDMRFYGVKPELCLKLLPLTLRQAFAQRHPLGATKLLSSLWNMVYARSVSEIVLEQSLDIIHAHFAWVEGHVGLMAARTTGRPLVVTLHGYDVLTEPQIGYGARLCKETDLAVREVLRHADAIICVSSALRREAVRSDAKIEKVHLIHDGVDLDRFNPDTEDRSLRARYGVEDRFTIFALRHHEAKYGIEYLIRAVPRVMKEVGDAFFIIGGDGSLRKRHEQLAHRLRVQGSVKFTGRIPRRLVPSYYLASDVVVAPSLQEGFGLTIAEAMACGKPVIGTKVGGIPDQIVEGVNGFMVQPRDPNAIADRIVYLAQHRSEASEMGRKGRGIAERKFDLTSKIGQLLRVYESIMR